MSARTLTWTGTGTHRSVNFVDPFDVFKQTRPVGARLLLADLPGNLRNVDARDAVGNLVQHLLLVQREVDRSDLPRYLC